MFIDLDHFKNINAPWAWVGGRFLVELAKRLKKPMRDSRRASGEATIYPTDSQCGTPWVLPMWPTN
jgi:GGDEF domain-containing protein